MVRGDRLNHIRFLGVRAEGLGSPTFTRRSGVASRRPDAWNVVAFRPFGISSSLGPRAPLAMNKKTRRLILRTKISELNSLNSPHPIVVGEEHVLRV